MTQTIVPAPAAPPDVGRDARRAGPWGRARAALGRWLEGSPGRLRVVAVLAVIASLVIAVGGGESLRIRSSALSEAADASGHLVLLQSAQTELQEADADATNSFLSGGLEPLQQSQDFADSLAAASRALVRAGQNSPADASVLGAVNADLTLYGKYIGSARAYNRQQLSAGTDYLNAANELMSADILPPLQSRVKADQRTIDAAFSRAGSARWWLVLVTILGLGGLLAAQGFLALQSRRILNPPLVGATVVVLVALLIGAGAMAFAQSHGNAVRHGALQRAKDISDSRLAAFNAKSQESLTLINQGSASSADPLWTSALKSSTTSLPGGYTAAADALAAYARQHEKINQLDVGGDYKGAKAAAVSTASGSANAEFAIFAAQTKNAPQAQADETSSGLKHARLALLPAGLLIVLAGLLAAAGAWWGVSLRLDEYR